MLKLMKSKRSLSSLKHSIFSMILQHFTTYFWGLFLVKFKVLQFDLQTGHSKEETIKQNPCAHYTFLL